MKNLSNVVKFENYKENKKDNKKGEANFLNFDKDMPDINEIIKFSNSMPDIIIRKNFIEENINNDTGKTIQEIVAEVYFKNYLDLTPDKYSEEHIRKAAKFINGIYDFDNTKKVSGHILYQKYEKERSICMDGYNCIQSLLS